MMKSVITKPYYWLLGATALILMQFLVRGFNYAIIPGNHISGDALFLYPAIVIFPITASLYLILKLNKKPLNTLLTAIHIIITALPIGIYSLIRISGVEFLKSENIRYFFFNILYWMETFGILLLIIGQLPFLFNFIIALFRKNLAIEK